MSTVFRQPLGFGGPAGGGTPAGAGCPREGRGRAVRTGPRRFVV